MYRLNKHHILKAELQRFYICVLWALINVMAINHRLSRALKGPPSGQTLSSVIFQFHVSELSLHKPEAQLSTASFLEVDPHCFTRLPLFIHYVIFLPINLRYPVLQVQKMENVPYRAQMGRELKERKNSYKQYISSSSYPQHSTVDERVIQIGGGNVAGVKATQQKRPATKDSHLPQDSYKGFFQLCSGRWPVFLSFMLDSDLISSEHKSQQTGLNNRILGNKDPSVFICHSFYFLIILFLLFQ